MTFDTLPACVAAYRVAINAPSECPTSTNGSRSRSRRTVRASAAVCSSIVYSASSGIGDSPNPSRSIAITR